MMLFIRRGIMFGHYRSRSFSKEGSFGWIQRSFEAELPTSHFCSLLGPAFLTDCSPLTIMVDLNTTPSDIVICSDQANSVRWKNK